MNFADQLKTPESALKLFKSYSLEPSDGTFDRGGEIADVTQYKLDVNFGTYTVPAKLHHTVIPGSKMKAHVEFRKSLNNDDIQAYVANQRELLVSAGIPLQQAIQIAESYRPHLNEARATRGLEILKTIFHDRPTAYTTEMYFLPWDPRGGAVELKIPSGADGPFLFLTAALSGCSVFVDGTPQKPRIFHCGTQENTGSDTSAKEFWKSVAKKIGLDESTAKAIHNINYGIPLRGEAPKVKHRQEKTKTFLKQKEGKSINVESVDSWGAVFGIRTGTDWTFYLQENVTVQYQRVSEGRLSPMHTVCRPRVLRQIFPGGNRVRVTKKWRELP
ncbi:MAG: hypothetical protein KY475_25010 [Planctomycetes bacterium]|nr:hypothetical protein [Planctomycetota bacterium]